MSSRARKGALVVAIITVVTIVVLKAPSISSVTLPKKGVVDSHIHSCAQIEQVGAQWYHNWHTAPACGDIEYVPGLAWGEEHLAQPKNTQWIMGYNEPDCGHWDVRLTAIRWHDTVEAQYGQNYKLLAPGMCLWSVPGKGRDWLEAFWAEYESLYGHAPDIQGIDVHCYDAGPSGRDCIAEFTDALAWARARGLELWITEFAALSRGNPYHCLPVGCPNCQSEAQAIQRALAVLDWARANRVNRIAWYNLTTPGDDPGAMDCNSPLFDWDGITPFGEMYGDW